MPADKTWKFKSSSSVSTLMRRVPAPRLSPNLAECSLKPRPSSGLLGARLLPVALDSNAGKTEKRSSSSGRGGPCPARSEEHTSELQSRQYLVCRLLLEKKKRNSRQLTFKEFSWSSRIV